MTPPRPTDGEPVAQLCVCAVKFAGSFESATTALAMSLAVLATIAHTDRQLLHAMVDRALDDCRERAT